jgi:ABC-type phosphate/phosphonate transport system substrate-binding protein
MSAAIASLPMYNLPEMAAANAAFWRALSHELAVEGVDGLPPALSFSRPPVPDEIGTATLFSQTCGYPLQTIYRGQHQLLGVPTYDAPGCGEGTHCAFILVRGNTPFQAPEDLRGTTFALNSRHSNSGMNLPRLLFAGVAGGRPFFDNVIETGSHAASIERVASGEAASASIDCLTYTFLQDHRPHFVQDLRILAETPPSPAIPFITAAATEPQRVAALRRALLRMSAAPQHRPVLAALRIRAIAPAAPDAYQVLLDYERQAAQLGYPELA